MKMQTRSVPSCLPLSVIALVATLVAGCSASPENETSEAALYGPAAALTARLLTGHDVEPTWRPSSSDAAGYVVEYAHELDGEYVPLAFLAPHETIFVHPRLVPDTTFHYRVRGYYGPTTAATDVAVHTALSAADQSVDELGENFEWAAPATEQGRAAPLLSLLDAGLAEFSSLGSERIPSTVSGFKLTWTDRFNDEEGFLLERRVAGGGDFQVVAALERDINAFGWAFELAERQGTFRVRAYHHGAPSNIASVTTAPGEM